MHAKSQSNADTLRMMLCCLCDEAGSVPNLGMKICLCAARCMVMLAGKSSMVNQHVDQSTGQLKLSSHHHLPARAAELKMNSMT